MQANTPSRPADPETLRQAHLELESDIRFRRLADEAVVIRQDAGEVLVVNELGARVLEYLEQGKCSARGEARATQAGDSTFPGLVEALQREYEATDSLASDVLSFLAELVDAGVASVRTREDAS